MFPHNPPTRANNLYSPLPCTLPGILALPGYDQGSVQALLTEAALPDHGFLSIDWVRTSEPGFQETIEILVDYHIEITSNIAESSLLQLKRPWALPATYISELYSVLAPFITKWASQLHLARTVAGMDRSEKFQGIQAEELRDLTTLFIKNSRKILTYFEPGCGPIALLSGGRYVQVPYLTRFRDNIFKFASRKETFILQPEYEKENPQSEDYIVKDLHDRGAWRDSIGAYYEHHAWEDNMGAFYIQRPRHYKYVAYYNRMLELGSLDYLPGGQQTFLRQLFFISQRYCFWDGGC